LSVAVFKVVCVPLTVKLPVIVALPATDNPVPFIKSKLFALNLAFILFDPAFLTVNSIAPSSVPSLTSAAFAVIFAKIVSWSASFSPLNLSCPK
jgi:hypothetical protein